MRDKLEDGFETLRVTIRDCLESQQVLVSGVADVLTSLPLNTDRQHKLFVEAHVKDLYQVTNIIEQFGTMNTYWNYLNPDLLYHLVKKFQLHQVKVVKDRVEGFESNLQYFRMQTPLKLYCKAQTKREIELPPGFQHMFAKFQWPKKTNGVITLKVAEQFRQEYMHHYSLHDCALMVAEIVPLCFIVTWFIPESIVEMLKQDISTKLLKNYFITRLEIAGACIYPQVPIVPRTLQVNHREPFSVLQEQESVPLEGGAAPITGNGVTSLVSLPSPALLTYLSPSLKNKELMSIDFPT